MTQKKITNTVITVALMLTLMLSLSACGAKKASVKSTKNPKNTVQTKNHTANISKNKNVTLGKLYVKNGMEIGTMVINKTVSDATAKILAEKYANQLKRTYKNFNVNVQAIKNGKTVANITLNK